MNRNNFKSEVSEFKGSTGAKLDIIFAELTEIKRDVKGLKEWKAYVLGISAAVAFIVSLARDWFFKR